MHRFFVPPNGIQGQQVTLAGPQAHQIARVLRLRPGDRLLVLDDLGSELEVALLSVQPERVQGRVVSRRPATGEPRARIALYQGVLKSDRFEWALQKGTELGVAEFVPLLTARTVIASPGDVEKKRPRWETILREAAEQSRRGRRPVLRAPLPFAEACEQAGRAGGLRLIPWEKEARVGLRALLRDDTAARGPEDRPAVHVFIGPEGGFTPGEVDLARDHGITPVTLGPRILRAETAGLAVVAALLYELGDLG